MSKWRPEGWKNPFSISSGADPADGERFVDYEAGADAMLGAVCEEIEKKENPYPKYLFAHSVRDVRWMAIEDCRQKILARLRSKGG